MLFSDVQEAITRNPSAASVLQITTPLVSIYFKYVQIEFLQTDLMAYFIVKT